MASSFSKGLPVSWGSALGKRPRDLSDESDIFGPAEAGSSPSDDVFAHLPKRQHTLSALDHTPERPASAMQLSDIDMGSPLQAMRLESPSPLHAAWAGSDEAARQLKAQLASSRIYPEARSESSEGSAEPSMLVGSRPYGTRVDTPLVKSIARHAPSSPSPLAANRPLQLGSTRTRQRSTLSQTSLDMMEEEVGTPLIPMSIAESLESSPQVSESVTPMSSSSSPWQSREGSPMAARAATASSGQRSGTASDDGMDLGSPLRTPTRTKTARTPPQQGLRRHQHSPGLDRNGTPPGGKQMLRYTMGYREDCELCRLKSESRSRPVGQSG
ncbi:uncharacterized protein PSFLO_00265 [Pseudozyma flocculosa]|uniref:Uncharacterized protein n=1 Tax=Pseudozyma flocculosa TaxID=84751 RepID=A0A5C3ER23_9BASI|nr:uncharacterized protein PSFLO_00265 [Pseudozyma flocculosa]